MRINGEQFHFLSSLDPAKRKASQASKGKSEEANDSKYKDRVEIGRDDTRESNKPNKSLYSKDANLTQRISEMDQGKASAGAPSLDKLNEIKENIQNGKYDSDNVIDIVAEFITEEMLRK